MIRIIIALLTSLVWLSMLFSAYPFKRPLFNTIAIVSALLLTCVYFGALLVKLRADLRDILRSFVGARLTAEDVHSTIVSTLSFNNADTILTSMVIFTLLVVVLVVVALAQRLWADGRASSFRLSTGTVPELTLRKGHVWHLLLSHSESSPRVDPAHAICEFVPHHCYTHAPLHPALSQPGAAARTRCRW